MWKTLPLLLLLGCGSPMTNTPELYVDADFAPDMQAVYDAVASWEPGGVALRINLVAHEDLTRMDPQDNKILLLATKHLDQSDCPWLSAPQALAGVTIHNGQYAATCVDVSYVRLTDRSNMQRTVAHELGHALGLPHLGAHSLMANSFDGPSTPTCEDWQALTLPGTFLPAQCNSPVTDRAESASPRSR